MEFTIQPFLLKLTIIQPGDAENVIREVDIAEAQDALDGMYDSLEDRGDLLPTMRRLLGKILEVEHLTDSMAVQIQGAIFEGYEEFKKKAPPELVSHLNTTSTPIVSTELPPAPSTTTSPDSKPNESSGDE